jgi:hypothetical protein
VAITLVCTSANVNYSPSFVLLSRLVEKFSHFSLLVGDFSRDWRR